MNINVEDLTNINHVIQVNTANITIPNQYYLNGRLNIFTNNHRVPDIQRYIVDINNIISVTPLLNKNINPSNFNDVLAGNIADNNSILLVLESPHKDEYIHNKINHTLTKIAPAQGKNKGETGYNIDCFLKDVLNEIHLLYGLSNGKYNFIICNPIPYMCSLGVFTPKLYEGVRNNVWNEIWNVNNNGNFIFRNEFINRCKLYKPKYIINGCTKYKNVNQTVLQRYVTEELIKNFPNSELYETPHPCSHWWSKKKIIKIIEINKKIVYIKKTGKGWVGSIKTTYFPKGGIQNTYANLINYLSK
jgi:hypothetical protein